MRNKTNGTQLTAYATNGSVEVNIDTDKTGAATVNLINANGRKLAAKAIMIVNGNNHISLPIAVVPGVYLIQVRTENIEAVQKIIK